MKAAETVFAKTKQQLTGDDFSEFHDHIIATNIRLPNGKDHLDAFLKNHPEDAPLRPALLTVFEGLQNVHELGSLVQIEERVEKELKVLKEQAKQQKFDPESGEVVEKVNFTRWKQQVMKRLKAHFQDEAEKALPTEAFFSQSAVKGLALFDLLARRYDVVAANPPYMGSGNMGPWLKSYVGSHYPEGKRDLYAAFILRDLQLSDKNGRIAMVTQQSWMFLRSFEDLRANAKSKKWVSGDRFCGLLNDTTIETICHLGEGAFQESADCRSICCSILFNKICPQIRHSLVAYRLIGPKTPELKERMLFQGMSQQNTEISSSIVQKQFLTIPQSPLCYWLRQRFFELLSGKTVNDIADVCQGLATANDGRYVRYHWEVSPTRWEKKIENKRWFPFEKGGGYGKWFGHQFWVIEWEKTGLRIKNFPRSVVRNESAYFKEGWTYGLHGQR